MRPRRTSRVNRAWRIFRGATRGRYNAGASSTRSAFSEEVTVFKALAKSLSATQARILVLFLASLASVGLASGQVSSLLPTAKPASSQPANPTDPLGRDTPRGTVVGFVRAAQDESERAIEYFQPAPKGRRQTPAEEQELASQLVDRLECEIFGVGSRIDQQRSGSAR